MSSIDSTFLDSLFNSEAVVTEAQARAYLGLSDHPHDADWIKKNNLIQLPDGRITHHDIISQEKRLAQCIAQLIHSKQTRDWPYSPIADEEVIARVTDHFINKSHKRDNPQKRAKIYAQMMRCPSRLVVLGGPPGTAKSTAGIELFRAYGSEDSPPRNTKPSHTGRHWIVAMNPFAMEKWRMRAGVQGTTLEQALTIRDIGVGMIPKGAFVIVDEAGLIGTEDMLSLLQKAIEGQWQKIILMGDIKQDMPKKYGQPLSYLLKNYPDISFQMSIPFRQRLTHQREFVKKLYHGLGEEALAVLEKDNRIAFAPSAQEAYENAAERIVKWRSYGKRNKFAQCFVAVPDKKSVMTMNKTILAHQKMISPDKRHVYPLVSPQGRSWDLGLGDRVILQRSRASSDDNNIEQRGQFGTIVHSDEHTVTVSFDRKKGERPKQKFSRDEAYLSPGYAITFEEAQGIAADMVCVLITEKTAGPQMISACSRHRYECHVIVDENVYQKQQDLINDIESFPVKVMPYLDGLLDKEDQ